PALSRFLVRSCKDLGRRVGDLYATNMLGAVLGCAFAGYLFIPMLGMRRTVYVAASINLLIAVIILMVDRIRDKAPIVFAPETETVIDNEAKSGAAPSWLGGVVLGSFGLSVFASLIYENAWTRARR